MEQTEQQIIQLTNQIQLLSNQIEAVDLLLEKDFDDWSQLEKRKYGNEEVDARKLLRSEKEQLRRKEEQLRNEKEQLREQQTILMKKGAEGIVLKEC